MKKLNRASKIKISILLTLGSALFLAILFLTLLNFINSGRVILGLKLDGEKIGGLSFEKAKNKIQDEYKDFNQREIKIFFGEKNWQLSARELGFTYNQEVTLARITYFGKNKNVFSSAIKQAKTFLFHFNLQSQIDLDSLRFEQALVNFAPIESPAQNARLSYNPKNDSFSFLAEKSGRVVDRQTLINNILENLNGRNENEIQLSLIIDQPKFNTGDLKLIEDEARTLIEQPTFYLTQNAQRWPIEKKLLASWISVDSDNGQLTLDENEIKKYLPQIAQSLDEQPSNVRLTMEKNILKILENEKNGKKLNYESSSQKIKKDILSGQKEIELVIDPVLPEITKDDMFNLGIKTLLGQGESNFGGSPKNRKYNLSLGASRLNGWLIKPGEEFSFNQVLGEVDEKNGYLPELVIKDKQTVLDYGGGICQVSTTLFRAAVNSGLDITERQPHAYPVRYYQPTGFDATVYLPSPDLKFINDTPNYILLQNKIVDTRLIFEIYGTSDNREIKIKGPFIYESNPDGSLKTTLTQEIWRDGQIESQNIFRSSYKPASLYPVSTTTPAVASPTPTPAPEIN